MFTYHDSISTIPADALVIGIEATRAETRGACAVNIDPQHGGGGFDTLVAWLQAIGDVMSADAVYTVGDDSPPAVAAVTLASAVEWERVAQVTGRPIAFVTDRPDLDALASMALADFRACASLVTLAESEDDDGEGWAGFIDQPTTIAEDAHLRASWSLWDRIDLVESADCFSAGAAPWVPSPLPTMDDPWGGAVGGLDSREDLAAINAACFDRSVPLADRVATVRRWVMTGEEPIAYRLRVIEQRTTLLQLATIDEPVPGVATVVVDLPGATGLGYCLAPVVVCESPNFLGRPGFRKFTVAHWAPPGRQVFVDLVARLNAAESAAGGDPTWGGNPASGIAGSSQARASALTLAEVVAIVSA